MPPVRRSREGSLVTVPPRPDSSNSTASLHSYGSRMSTAAPGAPYPPPPPRPVIHQSLSHPLNETQIMSMDAESMARILQAETARDASQTSTDLQTNNQAQPHHHQLQPDSQTAYFAASHQISFDGQQMDYSYATGPHIMATAFPRIEQEQRKGRQSTGPNENELKDMLERNLSRSLHDLAAEVRANEKTSSAEKSKQLFAMLWLQRNLVKAKGSVPRTRVHTQYASRCAKHHLQPLNPASFGKLVRVIIPDIQTRRLGVRGESKYHYVDLSLAEDVNPVGAIATQNQNAPPSFPNPIAMETIPRFQPDSAAIPSEEQSILSPITTVGAMLDSEGRVFPDPQRPTFAPHRATGTKSYYHRLQFPSSRIMEPASFQQDIVLPDIFQYTPHKTDVDAANALSTLYLTHVTSLIDYFRFCKDKMFFRLFTQFQGTLTVPVQKLLVHPELAPWVKECDYLMYQQMIKTVSALTLQVLPPKVMKFFHTVSECLDEHISKTFASLPKHVLDSKLEPATIFSQLLSRMLRVNQTAHAASVVLIDPNNRNRMWTEMVRYVQPKCMMNAFLPDCGYDEEVYHLLTHDMRSLLLPLSTDSSLESGTHYEIAAYTQNAQVQPNEFELDKICRLLENIKSRFPTVPSKDLVQYIQGVTSYILRDIVMQVGESYNPWLITKCFVDELALFLVHVGGFLERESPHQRDRAGIPLDDNSGLANGVNGSSHGGGRGHPPRYSSTPSDLAGSASNGGAFQGSASVSQVTYNKSMTIPTMQSFESQPRGLDLNPGPKLSPTNIHQDSTPFDTLAQQHMDPEGDLSKTDLELDDSGIGLSLLHESMELKTPTTSLHQSDASLLESALTAFNQSTSGPLIR